MTTRTDSNGYPIDTALWRISCEEQFGAMVDGLSWDPSDEGDAECVAALQDMLNEWFEAVHG